MRLNMEEKERDSSRNVVTKMEIKYETDAVAGGDRHKGRGEKRGLR